LFLSEKIAIASLVVALLAIAASIATPEIRCTLRLQAESCPESAANKAEAFYQKGSALLKLERYLEASESFEQSIALDPNQAKTWNRRGLALEKLGNTQQALASYEKALLLDPSDEIARQNREALLKQKRLRS
jgi:tetratricopeptide (TPR) repeat protein